MSSTVTTQAGAPPPAVRRNGAGTAALVTGVVALVLVALIIFFPLGAILGIVAAILGGVGMGRANRGEADNGNHATAGLVMGLLALAAAILLGLRIGASVVEHQSDFSAFWRCITSAPTEGEQNDCFEKLARSLDS